MKNIIQNTIGHIIVFFVKLYNRWYGTESEFIEIHRVILKPNAPLDPPDPDAPNFDEMTPEEIAIWLEEWNRNASENEDSEDDYGY